MKQTIIITVENNQIIDAKHFLDDEELKQPENSCLPNQFPTKNLIVTLMTYNKSVQRMFIGIATPVDWWHESNDVFLQSQSEVKKGENHER